MVLEVPGEGYRGCRCHSAFRSWMRSLIDQAHVAHELHFLDVSDAICKTRLLQRNASDDHPYQVDERTFDLFMNYFTPPTSDESFNVIVHSDPQPR